jgi:hypothetical protein
LRAGLRRGLGLASRSLPHCCTIDSIRQSLLVIAERTSSAKAESGTENVKSLPVSLLRRPRPDSLAAVNTATNVATARLHNHSLAAAVNALAATTLSAQPPTWLQRQCRHRHLCRRRSPGLSAYWPRLHHLQLPPLSARGSGGCPPCRRRCAFGRSYNRYYGHCRRSRNRCPPALTPPLPPRPQPLPAGTDATAAAEAEAEAGYPASPAVASATDAARRPGRHRRGCGCGCGCTDIVLRAGRSRGSPRTISAVPTCTGLGSHCQSWSP